MVEVDVPAIAGEQLRYNNNTWKLTGTIAIERNGELIQAKAKKTERVRGSAGWLKFVLDSPPASLNPGNLAEFESELIEEGNDHFLLITRNDRTDRYLLTKMRYI